jgi:ribonuclease HII
MPPPEAWSGANLIRTTAAKNPSMLEKQLKKLKVSRFAGVDEAGRGPLAGPVVACACILPAKASFKGLADSKSLTEKAIGRLFAELTSCPGVEYSVAVVDHETIDQINILQATLLAMKKAIDGLKAPPEVVLIDGNQVPPTLSMPTFPVVKGDSHCACVSAASVIAKFSRDQIMRALDKEWPEYGFAHHKGYGTAFHFERLRQFGPCPIHRKTYFPVSEYFS